MAVLAHDWLVADSRGIGSIRRSNIRSGVVWERVWVLGGSILHITVLGLALPELALWAAGCVAVVGGWTVCLLLLAAGDEAVFDEDGKEEEDTILC